MHSCKSYQKCDFSELNGVTIWENFRMQDNVKVYAYFLSCYFIKVTQTSFFVKSPYLFEGIQPDKNGFAKKVMLFSPYLKLRPLLPWCSLSSTFQLHLTPLSVSLHDNQEVRTHTDDSGCHGSQDVTQSLTHINSTISRTFLSSLYYANRQYSLCYKCLAAVYNILSNMARPKQLLSRPPPVTLKAKSNSHAKSFTTAGNWGLLCAETQLVLRGYVHTIMT